MEMNARPGLNMPIANRVELLPRLRPFKQRYQDLPKLEERIIVPGAC